MNVIQLCAKDAEEPVLVRRERCTQTKRLKLDVGALTEQRELSELYSHTEECLPREVYSTLKDAKDVGTQHISNTETNHAIMWSDQGRVFENWKSSRILGTTIRTVKYACARTEWQVDKLPLHDDWRCQKQSLK